MREIKFRAWNGAAIVHDVMVGRFGAFYVNPGAKKNGLDPKDSASLTPFNTKYLEQTPVMQYTGLKDKNGVEIYKGDVVLSTQDGETTYTHYIEGTRSEEVQISDCGKAAVEFMLGMWYLQGDINNSLYDILTISECELEVIGNIYENPELLA